MSAKPSSYPEQTAVALARPRLAIAVARCRLPEAASRAERRAVQSARGRALAGKAAIALGATAPVAIVDGGDRAPRIAAELPTAWRLSISHSGCWVAAVAMTGASGLGVDVESERPASAARLARDRGWIAALGGEPVDANRFASLWTLWEAAVKCDGASVLARDTSAFAALLPGWTGEDGCAWQGGDWWAQQQRLDMTHWLSVVVRIDTHELPTLDWHDGFEP